MKQHGNDICLALGSGGTREIIIIQVCCLCQKAANSRNLAPSGKRSHSDCWKITIFNRKYIFNPGPCSIAILVYRSVAPSDSAGIGVVRRFFQKLPGASLVWVPKHGS